MVSVGYAGADELVRERNVDAMFKNVVETDRRQIVDRARIGLFTANGDVTCAYCEAKINGQNSLPTSLRMMTEKVMDLQGSARAIENDKSDLYTNNVQNGITTCQRCGFAIWVRIDVAIQQNIINQFKFENPTFGMLGEWAEVRQTGGMCANATIVFGMPHEWAKKSLRNRPRFAMMNAENPQSIILMIGDGDYSNETDVDNMMTLIRHGSFEIVVAALNLLWAEEKGLREHIGRFS